MRRILSAFAFILITGCYAPQQSLRMETYKTNEVDKHYKKLLIVGEGNMQAKMYLQALSNELIKSFAKKNIDCHYEYLGDYYKTNTEDSFEKVDKNQYDAVLRMMPRVLKEKIYVTPVYQSPPAGQHSNVRPIYSGTVKKMRRHVDDFDLTLSESDSTIWKANLRAFIDPTSKKIYRDLRVKIMSVLEENKIVAAN